MRERALAATWEARIVHLGGFGFGDGSSGWRRGANVRGLNAHAISLNGRAPVERCTVTTVVDRAQCHRRGAVL